MPFYKMLLCFAVFSCTMAEMTKSPKFFVDKILALETKMESLTNESANLKTEMESLTTESADLKSKMESLETKYSTDMDAMQWQMYHVGASAACSGVTYYQRPEEAGSQPLYGWVYAHTSGRTCKEVCVATVHKVCVNVVRVQGSYGAQATPITTVGYYYTLPCVIRNSDTYAENTRNVKGLLTNDVVIANYCCCTQVPTNWKIEDRVTRETIPE